MVPPTATAAITSGAPGAKPAAALTAGGGGFAPGVPAALTAGPITGVSTINSRLPGAQLMPPIMPPMQQSHGGGDDDEDPTEKQVNPAQMVPEAQWVAKHPSPIQLLVQVSLGADAVAANVPAAIPLELSVRTKIQDMKGMLAPRVSAAGATLTSMKLKVQSTGYILNNNQTLAYYNISPGTVIELTKKQRGGK